MGHLLVMPRKHKGDLLDLSDEEYFELTGLLRSSLSVLKSSYEAQGFNIGLNHGDVAGAGIPAHLHWHILPRWFGDTNFFPVVCETKVLPETLKQTYQRLQKGFLKLNGNLLELKDRK